MDFAHPGQTHRIYARFVDATGAGVVGVAPTVRIRHPVSERTWDGDSFEVVVSNLTMTQLDPTSDPGVYTYDWQIPSSSDLGSYLVEAEWPAAANSPQYDNLIVIRDPTYKGDSSQESITVTPGPASDSADGGPS